MLYAPQGPVLCLTVVPDVGKTSKQLELVTPVFEQAHVLIQFPNPAGPYIQDPEDILNPKSQVISSATKSKSHAAASASKLK